MHKSLSHKGYTTVIVTVGAVYGLFVWLCGIGVERVTQAPACNPVMIGGTGIVNDQAPPPGYPPAPPFSVSGGPIEGTVYVPRLSHPLNTFLPSHTLAMLCLPCIPTSFPAISTSFPCFTPCDPELFHESARFALYGRMYPAGHSVYPWIEKIDSEPSLGVWENISPEYKKGFEVDLLGTGSCCGSVGKILNKPAGGKV